MHRAIFILILLFVAFAYFGSKGRVIEVQINPALCQYETRPLVNGSCDNSDPCNPMTTKDPELMGKC